MNPIRVIKNGTGFSFGNALLFNGANMGLNGHVVSQFNGVSKLTFNVWIYLKASTSGQAIIWGCNSTATTGFAARLASTSRNLIIFFGGGNCTTSVSDGIPLNAKTHLMLCYDGTQGNQDDRFYFEKDGTSVGFTRSGTIPASLGASGLVTNYGNNRGVQNFLNGWLDQISINYNSNRYSTFNGGSGRDPESSDLETYYKLNESNPDTTATDETGNDDADVVNCSFTPGIDGFYVMPS